MPNFCKLICSDFDPALFLFLMKIKEFLQRKLAAKKFLRAPQICSLC
jgi:hypothetical protein